MTQIYFPSAYFLRLSSYLLFPAFWISQNRPDNAAVTNNPHISAAPPNAPVRFPYHLGVGRESRPIKVVTQEVEPPPAGHHHAERGQKCSGGAGTDNETLQARRDRHRFSLTGSSQTFPPTGGGQEGSSPLGPKSCWAMGEESRTIWQSAPRTSTYSELVIRLMFSPRKMGVPLSPPPPPQNPDALSSACFQISRPVRMCIFFLLLARSNTRSIISPFQTFLITYFWQ